MRNARKSIVAFASAVSLGAGLAWAETVRLEAEDFKVGGQGVGYFDNDPSNNGGQYRTADGVDIENCSEGGYSIGWTNGGEWLKLTNDLAWTLDPTFAGGNYYVRARVAGYGGGPIRIEVDGQSTSFSTPNSDGWQNWTTTGSNPWIPLKLSAGAHEVKLSMDGGNFNMNWIEIATTDQGIAAMRALNQPGALPSPRAGQWGVREVWQNGNVIDLPSAIASINTGVHSAGDPAGPKVAQYYTPMINIHDSDANGHFPNDATFGVVSKGWVPGGKGKVDNLAAVMNGVVNIPSDGIYTFDVNSDDGFELAIDGKILSEANYGKGSSDVMQSAYLSKGNHDVRVLYWEGGGGSSIEVLAAKGEHSSFNGAFRPIGYKAGDGIPVPGFSGKVTLEASAPGATTIGKLADALQAITNGRAAGTNFTAQVDSVNHNDPDNGGGGAFSGKQAFPNNSGGDQDHFGVLASGMLSIPVSGTYQFGFNSDDGAAMQIPGHNWSRIVETQSAQDAGGTWYPIGVANGDTMTFDAPTGWSWTVGEMYLEKGEYPFNALMFEIGGGSFFELFGRGVRADGFVDPDWHLLTSTSAGFVQDFDGLQLVPEPSSMCLLALGSLGLLARRRRA